MTIGTIPLRTPALSDTNTPRTKKMSRTTSSPKSSTLPEWFLPSSRGRGEDLEEPVLSFRQSRTRNATQELRGQQRNARHNTCTPCSSQEEASFLARRPHGEGLSPGQSGMTI